MKHYVSYHNADKMGYTYEEARPFSVGTTKSVDRLLGNRVWSISGEGQPRSYFLRDTWIVEETGLSAQDEFINYAQGSTGFVFDPPVLLNQLPWFRAFLKSQNNFSLGVQPIKEGFVAELEALWSARNPISPGVSAYPDEVQLGTGYQEGAVVRVSVNAYERNPAARRACIAHHGTNCCICGFNFGQRYGPTVDGLIHVHHLRPLSEIGAEYTVDPVADLRPVCPNCHAVLHSRTPGYSMEEVRRFLRRRGSAEPM